MSKKAPSFEDARYTFTHANFVVTNRETGKPFFEMKRKTPTRPDGTEECYYIYKFYDENMPSEKDGKKMHEFFKELMCPMAGMMGIGMFSFDEISERCTEQVKKIYEGGRELSKEQIDVKIEVMDYATEVVGTLIVGISDKLPGSISDDQ